MTASAFFFFFLLLQQNRDKHNDKRSFFLRYKSSYGIMRCGIGDDRVPSTL